ncbi:MAG: hypothetical protein ABI357_08475 [Granulicella sp.]
MDTPCRLRRAQESDLLNLSMIVMASWKLSPEAAAHLAPEASLAGIVLLLLVALILWRSNQSKRRWSHWERDRLRELEAYCWLPINLPLDVDQHLLSDQAKLICKLVAEMSIYPKVALLFPNEEGELACSGSTGMDDLTMAAINTRCSHLLHEESTRGNTVPRKRKSVKSFSVVLGERAQFDAMPGEGSYKATFVPLRMQEGALAGVLAVCSTAIKLDRKKMRGSVAPAEILAARLARILDQNQEQRQLRERLAHLESMATAALPTSSPTSEPSTDAGPRLMRIG